MGFLERKYVIKTPIKATKFLRNLGFSNAKIQKILDRKRLRDDKKIIKKGEILESGSVTLLEFIPQDLGIKPLFSGTLETCNDRANFCVFKKPSNLLTHPKNLSQTPSLLDSIRYHFGSTANACHRLDRDTSGLILCSMDKKSEVILKDLFSNHLVHKEYLALLNGSLESPLYVESEIIFSQKRQGNLCIKGKCENLKIKKFSNLDSIESNLQNLPLNNKTKAITLIIPLEKTNNISNYLESIFSYNFNTMQKDSKTTNFITFLEYYTESKVILEYKKFQKMIFNLMENNKFEQDLILDLKANSVEKNYTLAKLIPITGRTHQLRIHTQAINHAILGDTLYGVNSEVAAFFLDIAQDSNIANFYPKNISLDSNNISIFRTFIYFYCTFKDFKNTQMQKEVEFLMRLYYTKSPRLMLHSNRLKFLSYDFCDFHTFHIHQSHNKPRIYISDSPLK